MKYRNIKTGAVVDVSSKLNGNWIKVESDKSPKKETVSLDLPIIEEKEEVKPVRTRKTAKSEEGASPKRKYTRKKKD